MKGSGGGTMRLEPGLAEPRALVRLRQEQARARKPRDQLFGNDWRQQVFSTTGAFLALRRQPLQRFPHRVWRSWIRGEVGDAVLGQTLEQRPNGGALAGRLDEQGVDRAQSPPFHDQARAPRIKAGSAASAAQAFALHRSGRESVDLDLRPQEAGEIFRHGPLSRLRRRVVGTVRIGDRDIALAPEIGRDVDDIASATLLHMVRQALNQSIVGDEISVQRAPPGVQRHVDDHFLGAGDARAVNEIVDVAEGLEGHRRGMLDRDKIRYVHSGEDLYAPAAAGITTVFELPHDTVTHLLELFSPAGDQHHARTRNRQQPADLAADARGATGNQGDLALVQAEQVFGPSKRATPRAGGFAEGRRQDQVDRHRPTILEDQASGLTTRKGEAFRLGVGVADDLVDPFGMPTMTEGGLMGAFVAPDTRELAHRRPQKFRVRIAVPVVSMGNEDGTWRPVESLAPLPIARQLARHGHRPDKFAVDEGVHVGIERLA